MKKLLSFCLSFILIIGCTPDKPDDPDNNQINNTGELWPLKIGNEWTNLETNFNESGSTKSTSSYTYRVTAIKKFNGLDYYALNNDVLYVRNKDKNTVEASGDGVNFGTYIKRVDRDEIISEIPFTSNSGVGRHTLKAFTGTTNVNGHNSITYEEEWINGAGTTERKLITYFSPGLGIVKVVDYMRKTNSNTLYIISTEDLQSYILK